MTTPLPLKPERIYLTDGGLETTLIFHDGLDLPCFAAFDLLKDEAGRETLARYYRRYADLAVASKCGFVFESPTWRASRDWGSALGYSGTRIARFNHTAIELMDTIRREYETRESPMIVSGNVGPRGDGYVIDKQMTASQACEYHAHQIGELAAAGAELVTAITLAYADEAIGIVRAAQLVDRPVVIGFTTETDGRLPSGQSLEEAIRTVDMATDHGPAYYMVNCAHVDHFSAALADDAAWTQRIRGIRANASRLSHAELDESDTLDDGDPQEFGDLYRRLKQRLPNLLVFGGCCGTDHRHVDAVRLAVC
jgi:S-methylmethionine-dependent homocysteine/selenocysteine methylase